MITPDEIRRKADNLYPNFLRAWLDGEPCFPKDIRANKSLDDDTVVAGESVRRLRDGSKAVLGYGYTVDWDERNLRKHGRNAVPVRIYLESQEDLLRLIGREREFDTFTEAVKKVRSRYPTLESWIRSNRAQLTRLAADVDGLLSVVDFLRENPRPGTFARALPLPVESKFIERHEGTLTKWLDIVMPPETIRADEKEFGRRFGLRRAAQHLPVRFLDANLQRECGCPWPEFSLPLADLAELAVPQARVLIVENKVTLLTLPELSRTLALGGLGDGVANFRDLPWFVDRPIHYWGDLDADGLAILAGLRQVFRQTTSLLMDVETLKQWREQLAEQRTGPPRDAPARLTDAERDAFQMCVDEGLRIEQEKFPQDVVNEVLRQI